MKGLTSLLLFLVLLSIGSAYLLAEMSFFGKMGISLFYKEYGILKNPVMMGVIIFSIQLSVVVLLHIFYMFASNKIKNLVAVILILLALVGLFFTYQDFTEEFSHRILKSKFHLGAYLIWVGVIASSIVYLFKTKPYKGIEEKI